MMNVSRKQSIEQSLYLCVRAADLEILEKYAIFVEAM